MSQINFFHICYGIKTLKNIQVLIKVTQNMITRYHLLDMRENFKL